jgi:hypothetical protein
MTAASNLTAAEYLTPTNSALALDGSASVVSQNSTVSNTLIGLQEPLVERALGGSITLAPGAFASYTRPYEPVAAAFVLAAPAIATSSTWGPWLAAILAGVGAMGVHNQRKNPAFSANLSQLLPSDLAAIQQLPHSQIISSVARAALMTARLPVTPAATDFLSARFTNPRQAMEVVTQIATSSEARTRFAQNLFDHEIRQYTATLRLSPPFAKAFSRALTTTARQQQVLPYLFLHRLQGDNDLNQSLAKPRSVLRTLLAQATAQTLGLTTTTVAEFMRQQKPENLIASLNALQSSPKTVQLFRRRETNQGLRELTALMASGGDSRANRATSTTDAKSANCKSDPQESLVQFIIRAFANSLGQVAKDRIESSARNFLSEHFNDSKNTRACGNEIHSLISEALQGHPRIRSVADFIKRLDERIGVSPTVTQAAKNAWQESVKAEFEKRLTAELTNLAWSASKGVINTGTAVLVGTGLAPLVKAAKSFFPDQMQTRDAKPAARDAAGVTTLYNAEGKPVFRSLPQQ